MNRREFVALVGVGGAMACAPEILGTTTDQEMTPAQAADGFVKVTGITRGKRILTILDKMNFV